LKLKRHQEKYAHGYPDKGFLVHEGGTGKTVCAAVWLKDGRDTDALVVCPKRVVQKWQETLVAWGTKATVLSKEDFKKAPLHDYSARVIDEADEFGAPLFLKGRSQLATKMYQMVRRFPDTPTLLLTATPIRSTPWNLHTLLCYLGIYIEWKQWRDRFFSLESRPFVQWKAWFPKPDWRTEIRLVLEKYADIVLLKDCVDENPPVEEEIVRLKPQKFVMPEGMELTKRFSAEHQFEQTDKAKEILRIGREYRKVLVVAYYVEQIQQLEKVLSKDKQTFTVYGGVKDQEALLTQANGADECYLIVQASLGAGFDADSFSCIVFASMSYKVRDFVQMKYRVRRIHNLHPVKYYYLTAGRCDTGVYTTIQMGRDFIPSEYAA
jgi:hypothetical protein